jgi:DNA-binding NtrC family response regulator
MADGEERFRILLTEEDTRVRKDIAAHLEAQGFEVLQAGDSEEAFGLLGREKVQGFVSDAHVSGGMDGHELVGKVREIRPDIAVVMISGHSDPSSGPLPEGAAFVSKPYVLEHLAPTLRRMIGSTAD